ncbi:MAG: alpha-amylase, partial [Chloroflexi bacterium]|nr:alpha-amylase [Chloroflexota bacterium]
MGIDSDWVHDHPDWFISLDYSPFPVYSFNGPELSSDPKVSIKLEDHYYTRTDAAVVFKHHDHHTGQTRYIYHGNDGTSMPWNDTAQLNYLNPEVREAVIQTILHVARQFPIIRFDAAMTLTKKHFQRLWYPQPGTGGDIPSRAEHAMSKEAFDQAMPEEFWREVVDRVAVEVPDTLLLAEAFWLMEGYFVRSLGMHRVYNSAFMNMLRNEENAKYRQLIKSTLTFDPEILKRYVNFMNNPDEKTAVEQFGKGDKYFGICTLLATMPGLPMFGHGQIEGYSEKYGMEYYRPYWDEQPDLGFVDAHRYNIFPILHRRKLFAEVADFRLYDFKANEREVDENVFAYSNTLGNIAALVIYNNRFGNASGWIKTSAPYLVKQGNEGNLHTQNLAQALRLPNIREGFLVMRDQVSRKFYLRSMSEVHDKGLFFDLNAYERMVLSDFHIVHGEQYAQLHAHLQGRPVDNIDATLEDLQMQPLLRELEGMLHNVANISHSQSQDERKTFLNYAINNWRELSQKARLLNIECRSDLEQSLKELEALGETVLRFMDHEEELVTQTHDLQKFTEKLEEKPHALIYLLSHAFISRVCGSVFNPANVHKTLSLLSKEQIRARVYEHYRAIGLPIDKIHEYFVNSRWLTACLHTMTFDELSQPKTFFEKNLANPDFRQALVINHHEGVEWFNKEAFETMLWNLKMIPSMEILADKTSEEEKAQCLLKLNVLIASFRKAERESGYLVDFFFNALSSD